MRIFPGPKGSCLRTAPGKMLVMFAAKSSSEGCVSRCRTRRGSFALLALGWGGYFVFVWAVLTWLGTRRRGGWTEAIEFRIGNQSKIDHMAASVSQVSIDTPKLIVLTQHQRGSRGSAVGCFPFPAACRIIHPWKYCLGENLVSTQSHMCLLL